MFEDLEVALREDAEEQVRDALRVGVCITHGLTRQATADKLNMPLPRVRESVDRLRSAATRAGLHPEQF